MNSNAIRAVAKIISKPYLQEHHSHAYCQNLMRLAHTYIDFHFHEKNILDTLRSPDISNEIHSSNDWLSQAKKSVLNFVTERISDMDVWSLFNLLSHDTVRSLIYANRDSLKKLSQSSDCLLKVSVKENILSLHICNSEKYRNQRELMVKVAKNGVTKKFLKNVCGLSDEQTLKLRKFSNTLGTNSGGQRKIDKQTRLNIIVSWENEQEDNKLKRFEKVLQKTGYDCLTASRVITTIL